MKTTICILLGVVLLSSACTDFWNEQPEAIATQENFYKTDADLEMAVTGIYGFLIRRAMYNGVNAVGEGSWSKGLFLVGEIGTDIATLNMADQINFHAISTYALGPVNQSLESMWAVQYGGINAANMMLARADTTDMGPTRRTLVAEARFLRGFYYYTLVRIFGGVPLLLEPSDPDKVYRPRATVEQCWRQVLEDFEYGWHHLPESVTLQGRATRWAAGAFLAKSHLTLATCKLYSHIGDPEWSGALEGGINSYEWVDAGEAYMQARNYAAAVIAGYDTKTIAGGVVKGKMMEVYSHNFYPYENTPEILFDVQSAVLNELADVGGFIGTTTGHFNWCRPTNQFVQDQMNTEPMNIRLRINCDQAQGTAKDAVWRRPVNGPAIFSKLRKEVGFSYGQHNTPINLPLMRLAEVYLIYAEAVAGAAEAADPAGSVPAEAFEALNIVARRSTSKAALDPIVYGTNVKLHRDFEYDTYKPYDDSFVLYDESSLTDAVGEYRSDESNVETTDLGRFRNLILRERASELCAESHRWYDLVRMGRLFSGVSNLTVYGSVTSGYQADPASVATSADNVRKHHILRPIPAGEIALNPLLVQNDGY